MGWYALLPESKQCCDTSDGRTPRKVDSANTLPIYKQYASQPVGPWPTRNSCQLLPNSTLIGDTWTLCWPAMSTSLSSSQGSRLPPWPAVKWVGVVVVRLGPAWPRARLCSSSSHISWRHASPGREVEYVCRGLTAPVKKQPTESSGTHVR